MAKKKQFRVKTGNFETETAMYDCREEILIIDKYLFNQNSIYIKPQRLCKVIYFILVGEHGHFVKSSIIAFGQLSQYLTATLS